MGALWMASQVWGVSANDSIAFGVAVAIVLVVGLTACLLRGFYRATRVDALVALRYEPNPALLLFTPTFVRAGAVSLLTRKEGDW